MRPFEPQVKARLELPIESEPDGHTGEGDARGVGHFLSRTLAFLAAALLCVLLIPRAWSQSAGRIAGTVKDQTNGAIPGATVAAVNIATGVKQFASTDEQGSYSFPVLSVGQYEIDVTADGF